MSSLTLTVVGNSPSRTTTELLFLLTLLHLRQINGGTFSDRCSTGMTTGKTNTDLHLPGAQNTTADLSLTGLTTTGLQRFVLVGE